MVLINFDCMSVLTEITAVFLHQNTCDHTKPLRIAKHSNFKSHKDSTKDLRLLPTHFHPQSVFTSNTSIKYDCMCLEACSGSLEIIQNWFAFCSLQYRRLVSRIVDFPLLAFLLKLDLVSSIISTEPFVNITKSIWLQPTHAELHYQPFLLLSGINQYPLE